jgi:uncharacterized protein YdeI (YjbR/CyaY-like superfamily)
MKIVNELKVKSVKEWNSWLASNHSLKKEVWLVLDQSKTSSISYIEAVYEAISYGWIDSTAKKLDEIHLAQRFTPRKKNSNWTELNKARARRLIALGKMQPSGFKTLPDLDVSSFKILKEVMTAINKDHEIRKNFDSFPDLYKRVRIGYIQEFKPNTKEFETRLSNFLKKTKENKLFGNWNDNGLLS